MIFLYRAAWNDLEGMPSDAAKQEYIHMVSCLSPGWQATAAASEKKGQGGPGGPVFSSLAGCMEESEAGPVCAPWAMTCSMPSLVAMMQDLSLLSLYA